MSPVSSSRANGGVVAEALERLLPDRDEPVAVSVLASGPVRSALSGWETVECPAIRGRTVWSVADRRTALVESPNVCGRYESRPAGASVLLTVAGAPPPSWAPEAIIVRGEQWHLLQSGEEAEEVVPGFDSARRSFDQRTAMARRLARRLIQLRGVRLAHGQPESPEFTVLVPRSPEAVCVAFDAKGDDPVAIEPLPVPGMPGAMRVSVRRDPGPAALEASVARFATAVRAGAGAFKS